MVLRSLAATAAILAVSAVPAAAEFTPGADGAGDPFYPNAGNGGYDVRHYSLKIDYEPQNEQLDQFFQVWLFEEGRPEPGSW